jgi:hypothetical protein
MRLNSEICKRKLHPLTVFHGVILSYVFAFNKGVLLK